MTPMVDLGFLQPRFSTTKATDLFMPKDSTNRGDSTKLIDELSLTMLLDEDNRVYYYNGIFDDAMRSNAISETNYSTYWSIVKIIRQKQKDIDASRKFPEGRKGLMLLIKPTSKSDYKNVTDALDEAVIIFLFEKHHLLRRYLQ